MNKIKYVDPLKVNQFQKEMKYFGKAIRSQNDIDVKQMTTSIEPPRDKTNKMTVRPAKTQISLGIRPV